MSTQIKYAYKRHNTWAYLGTPNPNTDLETYAADLGLVCGAR